uniref:Uncharacterized protein n=1 Tax=Cacopsylla melanoneura TaxID=428564 RepID=A0A8D8VF11_9HEMI
MSCLVSVVSPFILCAWVSLSLIIVLCPLCTLSFCVHGSHSSLIIVLFLLCTLSFCVHGSSFTSLINFALFYNLYLLHFHLVDFIFRQIPASLILSSQLVSLHIILSS